MGQDFQKGIRDGIPIALGYLSVSFTFGLAAVANGLAVWQAVLISLTNLTKEETAGVQLSLFGEEQQLDDKRDQKLDKTLDVLRGKFGSSIVQRGTVMKSGLNVARKFNGESDINKNKKVNCHPEQ